MLYIHIIWLERQKGNLITKDTVFGISLRILQRYIVIKIGKKGFWRLNHYIIEYYEGIKFNIYGKCYPDCADNDYIVWIMLHLLILSLKVNTKRTILYSAAELSFAKKYEMAKASYQANAKLYHDTGSWVSHYCIRLFSCTGRAKIGGVPKYL